MKYRLTIFLTILITFISSFGSVFVSHASAISGSEWQVGRIIDDSIFTDTTSMSVNDIQTFLETEMPSCDSYGAQMINGITRAQYGTSKGNPDPTGQQIFTCLDSYYEVPKTTPGPSTPASNYGYVSGHAPAGSESAAQIIYNSAQQYDISPKVLLVTLEKEQGLVTDDWPFNSEYLYAMGADCPDGPNGAQCDPDYAGFSLQMLESAKLFRGYLNDMTQAWWPYAKPYANNNILYDVTYANCGSSNVYIQTMATAALYTYTPYQPDQAALNNMYGTGDSCSAYGNRNFWRYFNDWFWTTEGNLYNATNISQSVYPNVIPGQSQSIKIQERNTGLWTWHDSNVNWPGVPPLYIAASTGPSMFSYGWPAANVAAINFSKVYNSDGTTLASNQDEALPGQIVEFDFNLTAPWSAQPGAYTLNFKPILAGTTTDLGSFSDADFQVNVPPYYQGTLVTQSVYPELAPGQSQQISLKYQNSGQWTWHDSNINWSGVPPVSITTNVPSMFSYGWPSASTATTTFSHVYNSDGTTLASNQDEALPGQIVEFDFNLTAPWSVNPDSYLIPFSPTLGNSGVSFGSNSLSLMGVTVPKWRASVVSQSTYPSLNPGQSANEFIKLQNTGAWSWHDSTINWPGIPALQLMTSDGSNNQFAYGWPSGNTASTAFAHVYNSDGTTLSTNQHNVSPGQIVEFDFPLTAPWGITSGSYPNYFMPFLNGQTSTDFGSQALSQINVNVP